MSTNNPTASLNDEKFVAALRQYHKEGKSSNKNIKELLLNQHGYNVSESTVKRRRTALGLLGSRSKKSDLSEKEVEQIVLQQLDKDRTKKSGKATITARIAFDQGHHISRDTVSQIMHTHDPEGFESRHPKNKKIQRAPVISIGIHEQWSADGHDKLYSIGFPIWAVVDVGSGKIIGQWVVPSNRQGATIGYLFLCLILEYKGMPIEFSTDCGSETTQLYGLVMALRELFYGDTLPSAALRAYRYSRSVHNITIERTWGKLRVGFGYTAVDAFQVGETLGVYDPENEDQKSLCMWLWAILLRQELCDWAAFYNSFKTRKDSKKVGPSGTSRNDVFAMPHMFGMGNKLLPLTEEQLKRVEETRDFMEAEASLDFVDPEFASRAQEVYDSMGTQKLTFDNRISSGIGMWQSIFEIESSCIVMFFFISCSSPPNFKSYRTMVSCDHCAILFPQLSPSKTSNKPILCGRCSLRKPGMIGADLKALNEKPQCAACGLVSHAIAHPICMSCIEYYKAASEYPALIFKLPGVAALIAASQSAEPKDSMPEETVSRDTLQMLTTASEWQAKATDNRLHRPSVGTSSGGLGLSRFKNLPAVINIKNERLAKREEAKHINTGLRINASLWVQPDELFSKMRPLPAVQVMHQFSILTKIRIAYVYLLDMLQSELKRWLPDAQPLNWENVTVHAHESNSKCYSLTIDRDLDLSALVDAFAMKGLLTATMKKDRKIQLRFAIAYDVFEEGGGSSFLSSRKPSTTTTRESRSQAGTLKRKSMANLVSAQINPAVRQSAFGIDATSLPASQPPKKLVRRSAFPIRAQPALNSEDESDTQVDWSRSCGMVKFNFLRTKATYQPAMGLNVVFTEQEQYETIEVSEPDFCSKQGDIGFIGEGFTKKGIYARFKGKEYVLTQPVDPKDNSLNVKQVLYAEYALLAMGHAFKNEFNELVEESGQKGIPKFYFNYEGSILGRIKPGQPEKVDLPLLYPWFIATPLLPCGPFDPPIRKFSGNNGLGEQDLNRNHMVKAVHAFTHFCAQFSGNSIVFCDLQGAPDSRGVMCIIDPQAHTSTHGNSCDAYWNGGAKALKAFKKEHELVCADNWVCTRLDLRETVYAEQEDRPSKKGKVKAQSTAKGAIDYILD